MSFYRIGSTGIAFTASGVLSVDLSGSSPAGEVVPTLEVEYVDASGARQTVMVVDGVTTITGVAPLLVQFNGSGSRCPAAFADQSAITDEEAYAYLMGGYRMGYGEGSGTWTYPVGTAYPKNEDTGPPLFSHIYREAGAYTAALKVRDALGNESTISCSVVVSAAPAATHIPVSAGAWPTWVSGSRYTLDAGGDYRSFGGVYTGGLHNIIIEKTGAGADPRIATFDADPRSKFDAVAPFEFRGAHIRLINIDIDLLSEGQRGYDYVGVIGGLVRNYNSGPQAFLWTEGSDTVRQNCRLSRGLFFEDTIVRNDDTTSGFVMFGEIKGFHAKGTEFRHMTNGPSTYLMLRIYGTDHSLRNCLWYSEANGGSGNGLPIGQLALSGLTPVNWRSDDMVGPLVSTDRYGYISTRQVMQHNQLYAAGSFLTNAVTSSGGGNPSGAERVYPRLIGWEDCVFYPSGSIAITIESGLLRGQYVFWRNVRKDMGAGAYIPTVTDPPNSNVSDNSTYEGPYFSEEANTRPVPTAF